MREEEEERERARREEEERQLAAQRERERLEREQREREERETRERLEREKAEAAKTASRGSGVRGVRGTRASMRGVRGAARGGTSPRQSMDVVRAGSLTSYRSFHDYYAWCGTGCQRDSSCKTRVGLNWHARKHSDKGWDPETDIVRIAFRSSSCD